MGPRNHVLHGGPDELRDVATCHGNHFWLSMYVMHITECQLILGFKLASTIIADRSKIFLIKYDSCNNLLFKLFRLSL